MFESYSPEASPLGISGVDNTIKFRSPIAMNIRAISVRALLGICRGWVLVAMLEAPSQS